METSTFPSSPPSGLGPNWFNALALEKKPIINLSSVSTVYEKKNSCQNLFPLKGSLEEGVDQIVSFSKFFSFQKQSKMMDVHDMSGRFDKYRKLIPFLI